MKSITLSILDLKTWLTLALILCFGLAVGAGILHRAFASAEQKQRQEQAEHYERHRLKEIQADQKKLDDFRY